MCLTVMREIIISFTTSTLSRYYYVEFLYIFQKLLSITERRVCNHLQQEDSPVSLSLLFHLVTLTFKVAGIVSVIRSVKLRKKIVPVFIHNISYLKL